MGDPPKAKYGVFAHGACFAAARQGHMLRGKQVDIGGRKNTEG